MATAALLRAGRKADFIELCLQFNPSGVPASEEVEALVTGAVVAANQAFRRVPYAWGRYSPGS